jgi:hypothetical protein
MAADPMPEACESPSPPPCHRRRCRLCLIVFAAAVILVLTSPWLFSVAVWDGRFALTLDVRSESKAAIKAVSYATSFKLEEAQWLATYNGRVVDSEFRPADRDNGRFVTQVGCSGRHWIFNIETTYAEFRYVVVRVTSVDGKKVRRLVEIPAGRGPRSVTVLVP